MKNSFKRITEMRKDFSIWWVLISLEKEAEAALPFNLGHLTNSFKQWRIVVKEAKLWEDIHMGRRSHWKWDETECCYRANSDMSSAQLNGPGRATDSISQGKLKFIGGFSVMHMNEFHYGWLIFFISLVFVRSFSIIMTYTAPHTYPLNIKPRAWPNCTMFVILIMTQNSIYNFSQYKVKTKWEQ